MASVYNKDLKYIDSMNPMDMLSTLSRLYARHGVTVTINASGDIPYLSFVKGDVEAFARIEGDNGAWCHADLNKVNNILGVAV